MNSRSLPTKVLDKRVKDGWFSRSYYMTLQVLTAAEDSRSDVTEIKRAITEHKVGVETYHRMQGGETYMVVWYQTESNGWLPYQT